jgi:chemotaxis family two-component system response regulator Rcp1
MVIYIIEDEDVMQPISVLIVEDNRADIRLIREVLKEGKILIELNAVEDGVEALAFLRREEKYKDKLFPDIVLLDLNMPRKNGFEVLTEMKEDPYLKHIPIIVMTVSKAEDDVIRSYNLHANAYIVKPVEFKQFMSAVKSIKDFWLTIVRLPPKLN